MGILIDIILIAILIISAFLGYKKGLVKLGAKLFAGIIAIIVTIIIYKPVANLIINNTQLDENIKNTIIENASSFIKEDNQETNTITKQVTDQVTNQVKNEILPSEAENNINSIIYSSKNCIKYNNITNGLCSKLTNIKAIQRNRRNSLWNSKRTINCMYMCIINGSIHKN